MFDSIIYKGLNVGRPTQIVNLTFKPLRLKFPSEERKNYLNALKSLYGFNESMTITSKGCFVPYSANKSIPSSNMSYAYNINNEVKDLCTFDISKGAKGKIKLISIDGLLVLQEEIEKNIDNQIPFFASQSDHDKDKSYASIIKNPLAYIKSNIAKNNFEELLYVRESIENSLKGTFDGNYKKLIKQILKINDRNTHD